MLEVIIILALLIPLIAVILDSPPARALAARLEKEIRTPTTPVDERVGALETEVERLSAEVERLREEGAFLQRLLEARAGGKGAEAPPRRGGAALPPGERRE